MNANYSAGSYLDTLATFNAAALTDVLLYGLHCVLFVICIFTIARNYDRVGAGPRRHFRWFLFAAAIAMFALSTADTAITFHSMRHDILHTLGKGGFHKFVRMGFNKGPIYVANNFIAELILLSRCYIIWKSSKCLLIFASLLVVAECVWGSLCVILDTTPPNPYVLVYIWSIFAINLVLTLVTVGRIIWIAKNAGEIGSGSREMRKYKLVMAVWIESSAVYSVCVLLFIVLPFDSLPKIIMGVCCMKMVVIMPTLLLIQVDLGHAVRHGGNVAQRADMENATGADWEFAARGGAHHPATMSSPTSILADNNGVNHTTSMRGENIQSTTVSICKMAALSTTGTQIQKNSYTI